MAKVAVAYQKNIFQDNVFQDNVWGDYAFQRNVFQGEQKDVNLFQENIFQDNLFGQVNTIGAVFDITPTIIKLLNETLALVEGTVTSAALNRYVNETEALTEASTVAV